MGLNVGSSKLRWLLGPACVAVIGITLYWWTSFNRVEVAPGQTPWRVASIEGASAKPSENERTEPGVNTTENTGNAALVELRDRMVDNQLTRRDITDRQVLSVMRRVPRHAFVPDALQELAYSDRPLPIGHNQTISQPYIVALMTQLAHPKSDGRALDIGTGSGYQAAVLAELVKDVYSIEIVAPLADSSRRRLKSLGYSNVEVVCGDGYRGLPQHAPFDVIIVAAAPDHVPEPLVQQLAPGGWMVIPIGRFYQNLLVIQKLRDGTIRKENVAPVAFVPMTGEAQKKKD